MPKNPRRNLERYQAVGHHLNEFEFQKAQTRMAAEEQELPFKKETGRPDHATSFSEVRDEDNSKAEKR